VRSLIFLHRVPLAENPAAETRKMKKGSFCDRANSHEARLPSHPASNSISFWLNWETPDSISPPIIPF